MTIYEKKIMIENNKNMQAWVCACFICSGACFQNLKLCVIYNMCQIIACCMSRPSGQVMRSSFSIDTANLETSS